MTHEDRSIARLSELISKLRSGRQKDGSDGLLRLKGFVSSRSWLNRQFLRQVTDRLKSDDNREQLHDVETGRIRSTTSRRRHGRAVQESVGDRSLMTVPKDLFTARAKIQLAVFLQGGVSLSFNEVERPQISVLLVLFNRAELTLSCLRSLLMETGISYEVIIVDNNSTDATSLLLSRILGATIVRNPENVHFLHGVTQAARAARGQHLLLLNNDTELLPGALEAALSTLESRAGIGAVGGKLILPDGRLQEAGSIIWKDGSCLGYARGLDPFEPVTMFRRDVDYCSGAFLLTPRSVFEQMRGFDVRYAPAYYEETDYCMRLWAAGLRVVYEPRAVVLHHEFASSRTATEAIDLQQQHQQIFVNSHSERLQRHHLPTKENILEARFASQRARQRVLLIDSTLPRPAESPNEGRSAEVLCGLVGQGDAVTLLLTDSCPEWDQVYRHLPHEVEVLPGFALEDLEEFLKERRHYYHAIHASGAGNIKRLNEVLQGHPDGLKGVRVVEDLEALSLEGRLTGANAQIAHSR